MEIRESTRKYILFSIILLIIVGLFTAKELGKKQDVEFTKDHADFKQLNQLYNEAKYEEAAVYSAELLKRHPDSEAVNYMSGLIAINTNQMEQAAILLQKTLELNPYKVENAVFMYHLGSTLYKTGRYEDAKTVLVRCRDVGWAPSNVPDYQQKVANMLVEIEAKL